MSSAFKALVPGLSPHGHASRSKGNPQHDLKTQFKPLGLSGDHLPPAAHSAAHSTLSLHAPPPHPVRSKAEEPAPKASAAITRLIRDGDRITHIEVQCSCGEVITLACNYSPADPA
jgi:hypothetical protein